MDATGERVQLAISMAELFSGQIDFENDLQPGDAFEVLFETSSYQGAVRRVWRDPRRALHQRRQGASGLSLGASGDAEGRILRRAGPLAPAIRARVAAPVHAARDLGVLAPTPAPGLSHRQGSPRRRLCRADGHAGRGGRQRRRRLGGMGGRRRTAGAHSSCERVRELLPSPVGVREGHQRGRARGSGTAHWTCRFDRHGHGSAPRLPAQKERRVRGSAPGARAPAARRTDSRDVPHRLRRGPRRNAAAVFDDDRRRGAAAAEAPREKQ